MTFWSALLLGFLASGHCTAMCSGLQSAFQPTHTLILKRNLLKHTLALNLGRVVCYVAIGGALALLKMTLLNLVNLGEYLYWLRVLSALVVLAIGLRMLCNVNVLFMFEFIGHHVWSIGKVIHQPNAHGGLMRSFTNGLAWGLLPCGLLYSVYFTAALSPSPFLGVQVMLGFAMGTLPSMLTSGVSLMVLKNSLNRKYIKILGGLFYCLGAILMILGPSLLSVSFIEAHPNLITLSFCVR